MAVSNSFLAKITSSFGGFVEPHTEVGSSALLQRLAALELVRATHSKQVFQQLATNSIRVAEHSIGLRDMQTLAESSEVLLNLPLSEARQAGIYYYALMMKRRGQIDEAHTLLEKIADCPFASYRARAIQTLGVIHHEHGDLDEAGRFYIEAICVGRDNDLITYVSARETISAIRSANGDHRGALDDLESLFPLFRLLAWQYPYSFYLYHADLAYELSQVGRIAEAEAACAVAVASPFAPAYPEWIETRDEIAAKRRSATHSVVAINRKPEAASSQQIEPERKPKPIRVLALGWLPCKKDYFQTSIAAIAATATIAPNGINQSILDWMHRCTGPRSPPALS